MTTQTWYMLGVLAASIALLVLLINSKLKFHPFLALLVVSVLTALAAGENLNDIPKSLISGAGGTLGDTGIVVFLGAMLGRLLADTGAVGQIADLVIKHSSPKAAPWVMTAVAFAIGIPMFFEVGMVVLLPIVYAVALRLEVQTGRPKNWYVRILIPAVAALSCLHGMVPPHPGPIIAVNALHANLGLTIGLGLICAIPTVILAGPVYARWIAPRITLEPPAALISQYTGTTVEEAMAAEDATVATTPGASTTSRGGAAGKPTPGAVTQRVVPTWMAFVCVLTPVALMLLHTATELLAPKTTLDSVTSVLGAPTIAMLVGVLLSMLLLGLQTKTSGSAMKTSFGKSMASVASVVLIIAGGGMFNEVLKDSAIGQSILTASSHLHVNVIVLGWLIGLILSFCTGSATVGIVSASSIVSGLMIGQPPAIVALTVIAIGAGSIGLNWVNHAGFWFVKEAFGMTIGQATKTHMMVQTIVSVLGLVFALILSLAFGGAR